ncbi:MAG: alpha/beta hydrolase [Hyphomicrobiaceae bacterium]|nr:alpha/beta hydrolase [Hyphomicrobiaceae bacterium]
MRHLPREHASLDVPGLGPVGLAIYGAEEGLPVLALHGAPASRFMFELAHGPARELGLTLHCPDRPGYGATPLDSTTRTLATRAAGLARLADALGLDRFAVLGISGGAPYAVALAAELGARVSALALVSPMGPLADYLAAHPAAVAQGRVARGHQVFFLSLPGHPRVLAANAGMAAAAFRAAPQVFTAAFVRSLSSADRAVLAKPENRRNLIRMTQEALRRGPDGALADHALFARSWCLDPARVTAKTVLWQGTADRIVPAAASFWLGERLPGCEVRRLDGHGHFWVYDEAASVLATLQALAA